MQSNPPRPDLRQPPRREADAATEVETPPEVPADLYDILGYRAAGSTVTTQQWLSMRCLSV
jgi:hypothetical protein